MTQTSLSSAASATQPVSSSTPALADLDPWRILHLGFGFFQSKALLAAVSAGLFTRLGTQKLSAAQIQTLMDWHPRGVRDLLDGLVAMRLLDRDGSGPGAVYRNSPESLLFLDRNNPRYVGGILEMCDARLYGFWNDLGSALKTGQPQTEVKHTGQSVFAELYRQPDQLRQFLHAMKGFSQAAFERLVTIFDFTPYRTLCDVGGATGQLSILAARRFPHLRCLSFDLPPVQPIAQETIAAAGVADRVEAVAGDFLSEALPRADVITMGMILHDWNLEKKRFLIQAAYEALPPGGAFVVIESLIDDERRHNLMGLMMSLNMMIEFGDAFDFSARDFEAWATEAGFQRFEVLPLAGPSSAIVAYK